MQQKGPREIEDFRSGGLEIQSFPASAAQKIKKIGSRTDRGPSVSLISASVGSPSSFLPRAPDYGAPLACLPRSSGFLHRASPSLPPLRSLFSLYLSAAAPVNPVCLGVGLY